MTAEGANGLWSSRPIEVTVCRGGDVVFERQLLQPFARIGRHPSADVLLPEAACPLELYLHATEEGIYCLGLSPGTANGWMGDKTYAPLGEYRVYARFADVGPPPVAPADDLGKRNSADETWPQVVVRGRHGEKIKRRLPGRLTVVGRNRRSLLRFEDETVCDVHCVLFWDGHDLWVVDLLSDNGTLLDGRRACAAQLPAGHDLLVGNNRLRWRPAVDLEAKQSLTDELRQRLAESERQRELLAQALGERQAEIERLASLDRARCEAARAVAAEEAVMPIVPEPPEQARLPAADDASRTSLEQSDDALPATAGQGLLGEELIERLLDFQSKREIGLSRRLLWSAAAAVLLVGLGVVAVAVARPWVAAHGGSGSNIAQQSLGEYPR